MTTPRFAAATGLIAVLGLMVSADTLAISRAEAQSLVDAQPLPLAGSLVSGARRVTIHQNGVIVGTFEIPAQSMLVYAGLSLRQGSFNELTNSRVMTGETQLWIGARPEGAATYGQFKATAAASMRVQNATVTVQVLR